MSKTLTFCLLSSSILWNQRVKTILSTEKDILKVVSICAIFSNLIIDLIYNLNDLHQLERISDWTLCEIVSIRNFTHHLNLCEEIQHHQNLAVESGQVDCVCLILYCISQPFQPIDLYFKQRIFTLLFDLLLKWKQTNKKSWNVNENKPV